MVTPRDCAAPNVLNVLSDEELLATIRRDMRAIYSDVLHEPLPKDLAAALYRLELRSFLSGPHGLARVETVFGSCSLASEQGSQRSAVEIGALGDGQAAGKKEKEETTKHG